MFDMLQLFYTCDYIHECDLIIAAAIAIGGLHNSQKSIGSGENI